MTITRPMLASEVKDVNELVFPMIATPKVDGIRCLKVGDDVLSRSFKPIRNDHIRSILEEHLPPGADGEIFSSASFSKVTSDVMSKEGAPDFVYYMFDYVEDGDISVSYLDRLYNMADWVRSATGTGALKYVKILPFVVINSVEELKVYEAKVLKQGFEGVILRAPDGPYKCGRSTWNERWLLKLKVFFDSEAVVLGMEEQLSNQNTLEKDALGLAKRSSAKAGKVPAGRLGKFLCRDIHTGVEFKCGTGVGLTMALRQEIWDNQDKYISRIFKYSYQPHGVKDKPRIPKWLGFRDKDDM